ncbi:MAG: FtsX-like permease family protein [Clostridiales bacterium]|nr:FtsX-like permease family protein [Clostridiales bacterium]
MFLRIFKKELKKRKAMNLIVLLFITLAAMFVGTGLNNVITVANGTDYYLEKAGIGDFVIVTLGPDSIGALDNMLETEKAIDSYRMDTVIFGSQDSLKKADGSKIETRNTILMQDLSASSFHFFNLDNEAPKALSSGHCYVTGNFMSKNNLKVGDIIEVGQEDVTFRLIIDGKIKDALFGSDMMGNTRILMHSDDFKKLEENETIMKYNAGQVCCIDTKDIDAIAEASAACTNIGFAKPVATIALCYVMDMIVAFVVLILSVCLIILSFVVLKVSLSFTISKEYREIGVMKAIGIKNTKIRFLYLTKYLGLAIIGSVIGFFLSIPLTNLLLSSVSNNMVLGNDYGLLYNAIGAVIVVITILILAYMATRIVKKATPVDAIRTGQSGERYSKKSKLHLSRSKRAGASSFLALNDTVSSPKRYISIIIAFTICMLFVLMLVNTTNTMQSDGLIDSFVTKSDLYLDSVSQTMNVMTYDKDQMTEYFDAKDKKLSELGIPGHFSQDLQYTYNVDVNGKAHRIVCQYGYRVDFNKYRFTEGTAPRNKNEIAITKRLSDMIGAKIGDTVTIDFGTEKIDCIITAYYESFNQVGEVIRLHSDAPVDNKFISSGMAFQIDFDDDPSEKVIEERKDIIKANFIHDKVENAGEYVASCINVVPTMLAVQYMLLGITIIIVSLITILMEVSFIADEKSKIALLKAIGFQSKKISRWHVLRFGIVTLFAMVLTAALSIPMTKLCISPIFGTMGTSKINYAFDPLQIFVIYPAIIVATTLLVAYLTSLSSKSIHASDTANIE